MFSWQERPLLLSWAAQQPHIVGHKGQKLAVSILILHFEDQVFLSRMMNIAEQIVTIVVEGESSLI